TREHAGEADDQERGRCRDLGALARSDGLDVEQHDEHAEQSEREHRVRVAQETAGGAEQRREAEGAQPGFLAAPLALDTDEETDREREREPRERWRVRKDRERLAHDRSERKVVVLLLEIPAEVLEVATRAACTGARTAGPIRRGRARPRASRTLTLEALTAAGASAQHDELAHVDLRGVARLVLLVLPLAILDAPLDV